MTLLRRALLILALLFLSASTAHAQGDPAARAQDDPAAQLFAAIEAGNAEAVQRLLDAGVDPNARAGEGTEEDPTALIMAIVGDEQEPDPDPEMVRALLVAGADPNVMFIADGRGITPLLMAAVAAGWTKQPEIVQMLLDAGADPNLRDEKGWTPLLNLLRTAGRKARDAGDPEAEQAFRLGARLLIEAGASLTAEGENGPSVLHLSAFLGFTDVMRAALAAGADPNASGEGEEMGSMTPLAAAALGGQPEAIRLLLEAGADPNAKGADGTTPLLMVMAAQLMKPGGTSAGSIEGVRLLLEAGADPNVGEVEGADMIPLAFAAMTGQSDLVRLLLQAGADPNARAEKEGKGSATVLAAAVAGAAVAGEPDVVRLLLEAGADPNAGIEAKGTHVTPLAVAAKGGQPGVVRLLLEAGANPNTEIVTPAGSQSALAAAKEAGHEEVAALLRTAGAEEPAAPAEGPAADAASSGGQRNLPEGMDAETLAALGLDEDVIFQPGIRYLTPEQAATAVITDGSLAFPKGAIPWLAEVAEGDVLWSPQGTTWATNFARRIEAVEDRGDMVIFRTRNATLTDIFRSMSMGGTEGNPRPSENDPADASEDGSEQRDVRLRCP